MKTLKLITSGIFSLVALSPAFAAETIAKIKPAAPNARIIPMNVQKAQEALEIVKATLETPAGDLDPDTRNKLALSLRNMEATALYLKEYMVSKRQMLTSIYVQVGLDVSIGYGYKGVQPGIQSGIGFALFRTEDPKTKEIDWAVRLLHLSGVNAEYKLGEKTVAYESSKQFFFGMGFVFPDNEYGKNIGSLSDLSTTYSGVGVELSLGKNFKWLNLYRLGGGLYTVGNPLKPMAHMLWLMPVMLGSGDRAFEIQGEVLYAHFFKDPRIRDEGVFYDFED